MQLSESWNSGLSLNNNDNDDDNYLVCAGFFLCTIWFAKHLK